MATYIEREAVLRAVQGQRGPGRSPAQNQMLDYLRAAIMRVPAADVMPVVRCKDCEHSTLPSELTQRYGVPGTLTCHNRRSPCNRRNVGGEDFCSYGERKDGGAK